MSVWVRDYQGRLIKLDRHSSDSSDSSETNSMAEDIPATPIMSLKDCFYPTRSAPPSCIQHVAPVGK